MKKQFAVIGLDSAGVQSLCHFLSFLDGTEWEVTSIYDPNIPIVGIGESANPTFTTALEFGIDFNFYDHMEELDATIKLGTVFKKWRDHDFINPIIKDSFAIHFNTFRLKNFILPKLRAKWQDKFKEIEGTVVDIDNTYDYADVNVNGQVHRFDYVMDCRGFPKDYTDYFVAENPTNHCLIHNMYGDGADWLNTGHRATQDGWMFEVPLKHRISYGYLFNNKITSKETAKENFAKEIGVEVRELQDIEYKFDSYYTTKFVDNRVAKNGNLAAFFEPMTANSLFIYNNANTYFYEYIFNNNQDTINRKFVEMCESVHDIIFFCYHGGSIYNTEFWNYAKPLATKKLWASRYFNSAKNKLQELDLKNAYTERVSWVFNELALRKIDKNFGYNYFSNPAKFPKKLEEVMEDTVDIHKPKDSNIRTTQEIQKQRLATCKECEHRINGLNLLDLCTKCGCVMQWKTWINGAQCPVGKW
jgi:hypothetical protein